MANRTAPRLAAVALSVVFPCLLAFGQPTNADILGRLMSDCATNVADRPDSLRISPDQRYDFLRTALVAALKERGTVVFLDGGADTTSDYRLMRRPKSVLTYRVEDSDVHYDGTGGLIERRISLASRILLTTSGGEVLADTLCQQSFADQVRNTDLATIEDPRFEITQGVSPRKGWLRRVAEPAVVAAASVVAVYLFFSVRSDKNDSR